MSVCRSELRVFKQWAGVVPWNLYSFPFLVAIAGLTHVPYVRRVASRGSRPPAPSPNASDEWRARWRCRRQPQRQTEILKGVSVTVPAGSSVGPRPSCLQIAFVRSTRVLTLERPHER
jgi:hypothetical protein